MFQYTKEVIINSLEANLDAYGSNSMIPKMIATPGMLNILRAGEYKLENIQDKMIHKTPGRRGVVANQQIVLTNSTFATAGIYRITVYLRMNNLFLSDFANANWYPFGKPIMAEFEITEDTKTPTLALPIIKKAMDLAIPYNNVFAKVSIDGTSLVVTLTNPYTSIISTELEMYNEPTSDSFLGSYTKIPVTLNTVANVEPFATGEWMQHNLRFPSYPNLRYEALYEDEYPKSGALYTEYSFAYDVVRKGYYGMSGVGQKTESITRHVYYVLNDLVEEFEKIVSDAFGDNVIVEENKAMILTAPTVANDGVAVQLIADVYPHNDTLTYTWEITGTIPTGVTLTSDGVLTVLDTVAPDTTFVVKVTPNGPEYIATERTFVVIEG